MKVITSGGQTFDLGVTETTPTIGIIDYSRRVTDDYGVTTVVRRGFSRRLSVRLGVSPNRVDALQQRLASLRATSARWVADSRFASLSVEGFYKDFDIDVATAPLSYCTLTVEGIAETQTFADAGGDPAPFGVSTLQMLRPIAIDDTALVASSVSEIDTGLWSASSSYSKGMRVQVAGSHRVYESLADSNRGFDPTTSPGKWLDIKPTNRWAMFDQALGTTTNALRSIEVTLKGAAIGAVALLDVVATRIRVQATGYDQAVDAPDGPTSLPAAVTFLDLPAGTTQVTVTITGPGAITVGTLLAGSVVGLGVTETSPTAGITDYSRKVVDDFGAVTVVQRAWAKRMTARALIDTGAIDTVFGRIAAVRAMPVLWIGSKGRDCLTVYGFFRDFSIEGGETVSKLSLSIEGLSTAGKTAPLVADAVAWSAVTDPDGTKPANNATNSADPNSAFGSGTVGGTVKHLATLDQAIATVREELSGAEGLTQAAIAARDAAKAAATNAATARDDSRSARDAAQKASGDALASAGAAAGSAGTAEGQATIASTKATTATEQAAIAKAQATLATTKAGDASTSASSAATSEQNASGSATAAATQARVAAQSSQAAGTRNLVTKGDFADGDPGRWRFMFGQDGTNDSYLLQPALHGQLVPPNGSAFILHLRGRRDSFEGSLDKADPVNGGWIRGNWGGRKLRFTGLASGQYSAFDGNVGVFADGPNGQRAYMYGRACRAGVAAYEAFDFTLEMPAGTTEIIPWVQNPSAHGDLTAQVRLASLRIEDVTDRVATEAAASAAAESASSAATSKTAAGQRASAAESARTEAVTAAGNAATYRDQASTSATGASGSAALASIAATVAASSATGDLVKHGQFRDGQSGYWRVDLYETRMLRPADYGQPVPPGQDWVYLVRGFRDVLEESPWNGTGPLPPQAGRIPGDWGNRVIRVQGVASCQFSAYDGCAGFFGLGADGSVLQYGAVLAAQKGVAGYRQFSGDIVVFSGVTIIIPWLQNSAPPGDVSAETRWASFSLRDVTEEVRAGQSASAAAGSATTASTRADDAGRSASAAQTAYTNAEASNQGAATSARSAAGSASAASRDAGSASSYSEQAARYAGTAGTHSANAKSYYDSTVSAAGALSSRVDRVETDVGGAKASASSALTAVGDVKTGLSGARLRYIAESSGGRAVFELRSDNVSGAKWELGGDGLISGSLTVDGTLKARSFDRSSMSREARTTWSGTATPAGGKEIQLPGLGLPSIPPVGRFLYEFSSAVSTNANQRQVSTRNGKPAYLDFRADGGLRVRAIDGQGNEYSPRSTGTTNEMIRASTDFNPNFAVWVFAGTYDTGWVDDGDYYRREMSATYSVTSYDLRVLWLAI